MEFVFSLMYRMFDNVGLAIAGVSIAVNLLSMPLYRRADALQEEERRIQKLIAEPVKHIRKSFKGDERVMILQAFYRIHNYSPVYVFRASLPLLLQIPFFTAAYSYLSNLYLLKGSPFWIIKDMGSPDQLLTIFGITLNVLPILMTVINFVSGMIYTKGFPLKDRLQPFILALIFLVFLYNMPAGLVLYWTLNNLFSLCRNTIQKVLFSSDSKEERYPEKTVEKKETTPLFSFLEAGEYTGRIFLCSALSLTVIFGMIIPVSVISSSPDDFVRVYYYINPLYYIVTTSSIAAGFFLVWGGAVIYFFGDRTVKTIQTWLMFMLAIISIVDDMIFGKNFGTLSASLVYSELPDYTAGEIVLNLAVLILIIVLLGFVYHLRKQVISGIALIIVLGGLIFTGYHAVQIQQQLDQIDDISLAKQYASVTPENAEKIVHLSKSGKNVVIILLDRAINGYVPYMFNERPELFEQFSGFTYYPNTLSFGEHTIFAGAAVYGGYEYTPSAINERKDDSLEQKINEADLLMPRLFSEHGYMTAIADPAFAGYKSTPDLSIYDPYPGIRSFNTKEGQYMNLLSKNELAAMHDEIKTRNFFCYSLFRTVPVLFRKAVYDTGNYFGTTKITVDNDFLMNYAVLKSLSVLTEISDDTKGGFFMVHNNATHEPSELQMPDYVPDGNVNNSGLDDPARFTLNGRTVHAYREKKPGRYHYHVNMSSIILLGKWFDYLKEEGVYDNTRIIIVSDHGFDDLGQFEDMIMNDELDLEGVNPLLMVKDFNSEGFKTDNSFMTNADIPSIAMEGIIDSPVNPFTGNTINMKAKNSEKMLVTLSSRLKINEQKGNTFITDDAPWYSVKDNIFNKDNWTREERSY